MIAPQIEDSISNPRHDGNWYALHTRHQHEKTIAELLTKKEFGVFLPLYMVARRWKDRTKELSLPLFPCYLFIQGGLDRRLAILTTPGVHGIVGWGGKAAAIPQAEIDAVRRIVEGNFKVEPYPFLKCGDWVRIKSGPLTGIEGILVRKKNLFRLVLSVEMLVKSAAVEVEGSDVEPISRRTEARITKPPDVDLERWAYDPFGRTFAGRGPSTSKAGGISRSEGH